MQQCFLATAECPYCLAASTHLVFGCRLHAYQFAAVRNPNQAETNMATVLVLGCRLRGAVCSSVQPQQS